MSDDLKQTVRIVRKPKVKTDDQGRSVWAEPVEAAELELVSTAMLTRILESDDEKARERFEEIASGDDGVLAHDAQKNTFEIVDDDDLEAALAHAAGTPELERQADVVLEPLGTEDNDGETDEELSLVSTQMLRQILASDDPEANVDPDEPEETGGGFDPYNHR